MEGKEYAIEDLELSGDVADGCYKDMYKRLWTAVSDTYGAINGLERQLAYIGKQLLRAQETCESIFINSVESPKVSADCKYLDKQSGIKIFFKKILIKL